MFELCSWHEDLHMDIIYLEILGELLNSQTEMVD
jgi:hypothetical protein